MRTAVVVGFDFQVGIFCRKMNAHAVGWRFVAFPSSRFGLLRALLRLRTADALIRFAGPGPHPLLLAAARTRKIPVVVIWVGSDVLRAAERPDYLPHSRRTEFTHVTIAPWLVDELKAAGISARYVPIMGFFPDPREMPKEGFRVVTYLPEPRRDFYGRQHVYEVARNLPDVEFSIVGVGGPDPSAPPNARFYGWIDDVGALLDKSTVLLRVPEHDGMSLIVLEALARGRFVVWKYQIPGVKQVETPEETLAYLRELRELQARGRLECNRAGIDYIATAYLERPVSLGVEALLAAIAKTAASRKEYKRRVAISGHELFAADVTDLNGSLSTGWDARMLHFETTYEVVGSLCVLAASDVWYTVGTPRAGRTVTRVARFLKKPRVVHWVGTDIEVARRSPGMLDQLRAASNSHITEVEWEAEELRSLGITARIAPLPPRFTPPGWVPALPSEFTLLAYVPRSRADFYGSHELEAIIRAFAGRQIKFLIVGGGSVNAPIDVRLENLGWVYSLDEVYARSSALLRFTPRDGLSLMVLEALAYGRQVLWTKSFPFVRQVLSVDAICQELDELLSAHAAGELRLQDDAAQFVRTTYDREKCIRAIASAWDEAALKRKRPSPLAQEPSEPRSDSGFRRTV